MIKVGDWVRTAGRNTAYKIMSQGDIAYWQPSFDAGLTVRVIVRDAKTPRKVKANELWAWLHKEDYVLRPWSSKDEHAKWGVAAHVPSTVAIAVGPTPLKAIISARKALRKAALMKAKHMTPEDTLDDNK